MSFNMYYKKKKTEEWGVNRGEAKRKRKYAIIKCVVFIRKGLTGLFINKFFSLHSPFEMYTRTTAWISCAVYFVFEFEFVFYICIVYISRYILNGIILPLSINCCLQKWYCCFCIHKWNFQCKNSSRNSLLQ